MIFFEPRDLLDLSEGDRGFSFSKFLLGKRVKGVGGNEALWKWLSRFLKKPPKNEIKAIQKLCEIVSISSGIEVKELEKLEAHLFKKELHRFPWLTFLRGTEVAGASSFKEHLPQTMHLLMRLDLMSLATKHCAKQEDNETLAQFVRILPLSSNLASDSLRLIREMHARLMDGNRGGDKNPGEFRRSQNWIGGSRPGNAMFVPPPVSEPDRCLPALNWHHVLPRSLIIAASNRSGGTENPLQIEIYYSTMIPEWVSTTRPITAASCPADRRF